MRYAVCALAISLTLLLECCRQQSRGYVVARVGDAKLTLEEALAHIDTTQASLERSLRLYATSWINAELIYQEAQRQGIESSEEFGSRLRDTKRQLVNQIYLQRKIYNDSDHADEQVLKNYYQKHSEEFLVREEMIRLNLIIFSTRDRANTFAARVTRGTPWKEAVESLLADSVLAASVVSETAGEYLTQSTILPPELWKVSKALNRGEVSFPVRTTKGYVVLQPLDVIRQGERAEFKLVRDEVVERCLIEERRKRYEELLGTLRQRYNVEIMLSPASQADTLRQHMHE